MKLISTRRFSLVFATIIFLMVGTPAANGQGRIQISGYAGYQFWGSVEGFLPDGTPIEASIEEAVNWGASLGYKVEETIRFEVSYLNQATSVSIKTLGGGISAGEFDMTVHYIQAGAMYEAPSSGKALTPYGGLSVGAVNFDPEGPGSTSVWRLAFGLNGGLKVYIGDNFGLRGQASLLIPIQWSSGAMFCGGSGCTVGVSGGTAILQGAVTGGLFLEI